jgi:hypothetical protein
VNEWGWQQTRRISGKGIIRPSLSVGARAHRYFIDVVRFPTTDFFNAKWNPPRSEYAKISYVSDGYVSGEETLRYPKQVLYPSIIPETAYFNPYLECHFGFIEEELIKVVSSPVVGGTPGLPPSLLLTAVQAPIEEIRFVCRDDTAIEVREFILLVDFPCASSSFEIKRQEGIEGSPTSPVIVPPGTPVETTPPYSGDDNGNTQPFPGDEPPPPSLFPFGSQCTRYIIDYRTRRGSTFINGSAGLWGTIQSFGLDPLDSRRVIGVARGIWSAFSPGQFPCLSPGTVTVVTSSSVPFDEVIVDNISAF